VKALPVEGYKEAGSPVLVRFLVIVHSLSFRPVACLSVFVFYLLGLSSLFFCYSEGFLIRMLASINKSWYLSALKDKIRCARSFVVKDFLYFLRRTGDSLWMHFWVSLDQCRRINEDIF